MPYRPTMVRSGGLEDVADIDQVLSHVGFHFTGLAVGFQIAVARKTDVADGVEDGSELDVAVAQHVGIVFQMELADAILAQPSNLFDGLKAGLGGITHIVVNLYVL